ncbi:flagellar assembly protein FliW [Anaerotignum sp. MB30-C6]|uniref:flagellar assembly protein FliW n=1 Tax=Anaerotignum sp. MB30-C6 TaxID=3070814 RepID=UPI0027DABCA1|nr:flagellar assembly protein FliW [Anaerotignum sp. MB30-C6]WMI81010.1 flagellar assembly protein FliW [Anaerotignum sp. MB30-C6]
MELVTKYFSNMEFSDKDVILFENGLFGFEQFKKFILIRFENNSSSPICLQSIDDGNIAFVMINPYDFIPDYSVPLGAEDYKDLKLEDTNNLAVYNICVLKDDVPQSTTNLRCPVIVNTETRLAKQIVLDNTDYPFKYPFQKLINKEG